MSVFDPWKTTHEKLVFANFRTVLCSSSGESEGEQEREQYKREKNNGEREPGNETE